MTLRCQRGNLFQPDYRVVTRLLPGVQEWHPTFNIIFIRLGSVVLDLEEVPLPFSNPRQIKDHHALVNRERQSLFEQRRFYGWWPVVGKVKVKSKGRSKNKKKEKITKLTVSTGVTKDK